MNIEKLTIICNSNAEDKREAIISVLAEDDTIMIDLLAIATAKQVKDQEMIQATSFAISEALHFIEHKCKKTPDKAGITREYLMKKIYKLCNQFPKIKL